MFFLLNIITYRLYKVMYYNQILPFITACFLRVFALCQKGNPKMMAIVEVTIRGIIIYKIFQFRHF